MRLSMNGLDLLKKSEGLRLRPYLDVAGFPTIGYGHKLNLSQGQATPPEITEAQAEAMLAGDVLYAERVVATLVKATLTQGQFDALVDFVFNLGPRRLADSTLLRDLNAGDYVSAASQLLRWDHAAGKELPALKARREAEFKLWHEL
jgi:lysozyme